MGFRLAWEAGGEKEIRERRTVALLAEAGEELLEAVYGLRARAAAVGGFLDFVVLEVGQGLDHEACSRAARRVGAHITMVSRVTTDLIAFAWLGSLECTIWMMLFSAVGSSWRSCCPESTARRQLHGSARVARWCDALRVIFNKSSTLNSVSAPSNNPRMTS